MPSQTLWTLYAIFKPMTDTTTIKDITLYCIDKLDLQEKPKGWEYSYSSLPFCVIDSVFSIGVRYEGVINTIGRLNDFYKIESRAKKKNTTPEISEQIPTSKFLEFFSGKTIDFLASDVFGNRQRTSTANGILKVEAVIRFLKVLKDFGVEYYQDTIKVVNNESFEFCIKHIPGQGSGLSLKYFFMLAGFSEFVKPDRMVLRFLKTVTGHQYNLADCQRVLSAVTKELNEQGYKLTPQSLDNAIWLYQRDQK